jgi:formyl-CoA transferase
VENYRPGVMEALNIGYGTMSERNPGIIYCAISGFGVDGPFADRPGLDQIVQGFSGLMSVTGFEGGDPVRVGIPIADLLTGLYGAYGVLAALYARQETGRGQVVNTSLLESMVGTLAFQGVRYLNGAGVPPPAGNHHPINAPYGVYRTKDGYITIGGTGDKRWPKLCELLGMPDLPKDPRFNTNGGRHANRFELAEVLESKLSEKTSDEWEIILNENSIPCGPIYNVGQALDHPQVLHREMVVERPHPTMGTVRLLGLPVKLAETPGDVFRVPPLLGEQSDEILSEIGIDAAEVDRLRGSGIIGERPATERG